MMENTYLYYDEQSLTGVIVDPGGDEKRILRYIDENSIKISHILLTHGHFDHISGVNALKEALNAKIVSHKDEAELLSSSKLNLSLHLTRTPVSIKPDVLVLDNDVIGDFKVIHTPGHTLGGVCFYDEKNKTLFSGDTLFLESIGRTDFPNGSSYQLLEAITEKLFKLPEDVCVYPGHGPSTTIGNEKVNNPFVLKA